MVTHALKYLIVSIIACALCLGMGSGCANKTAKKLNKIYKDKLTAYQANMNVRIDRLSKRKNRDTLLRLGDFNMDKYQFFKLIVETNYYNLELKTSPAIIHNNFKEISKMEIKIISQDFYTKKNKNRRYCDEDIVQLSDEFNKNWGPEHKPANIDELVNYMYYKSDILSYLLQNKCY